MNRRRAIGLIVAVFSAGWIAPLWLGIDTYLTFWEIEAWPLIAGKQPGNSFQFISFARDCFTWSLVWLAAVVVFWSYLGFQAVTDRRSA